MQMSSTFIIFITFCADFDAFKTVILHNKILLDVKHLHNLSWMFLKALMKEEFTYLMVVTNYPPVTMTMTMTMTKYFIQPL